MPRKLISSGSTFEAQIGYSRAVVTDDWVFVSGTTGFDYSTTTIPDGIVAQTEQCMRNIVHALGQADASLADVVRVTYVLPDATEIELTPQPAVFMFDENRGVFFQRARAPVRETSSRPSKMMKHRSNPFVSPSSASSTMNSA